MPAAELAHPPQEDVIGEVVIPPARKLQDLIRLAELCVDLLRQNEEFYAEVMSTLWDTLSRVVLSCCHISINHMQNGLNNDRK